MRCMQRRQVVAAVREHEVVAAAAVAGALHAELARAVGAQEIALHDAVAHDVARRGGRPLRCRTARCRVRAAGAAPRAAGCAARTPACRASRAGTTTCDRGCRRTPPARRSRPGRRLPAPRRAPGIRACRAVARRGVARVRSPAMRPTCAGGFEVLRRARGRVPVVALHRAVFLADHRAVDVMPRAAVAAQEPVRIRVDELRLAARDRGAFASCVMRGSTASAAASASRPSSIADSTVRSHG